jgi:hypothetical protein
MTHEIHWALKREQTSSEHMFLSIRNYLTRFAKVFSLADVVCSKGSNLKMFLEISTVVTPDVTSGPFTGACTSSFHDQNWMRTKIQI